MKNFFKSSAFKCIVVLLTIVLVCSVFLTLCNALLFVSPEERFNRAIAKLYQGETVETKVADGADSLSSDPYEIDRAFVLEAYVVTSENYLGDYIVKSRGRDGFQNGTVTCWVVVQMEESAVKGIRNIVIDSNTNQSYISKVTNAYLDRFGETYDGTPFTTDDGFLASGASYSSNAICNAVNGALEYVKDVLQGESSLGGNE